MQRLGMGIVLAVIVGHLVAGVLTGCGATKKKREALPVPPANAAENDDLGTDSDKGTAPGTAGRETQK